MSTQMAERKREWPETGDLIITTIEKVTDCDAYVVPSVTIFGKQDTFRRDK